MIERKTWEEFRSIGLLWWINRMLHLFGWAICYELDQDGNVKDVFPARCKFIGFDRESETEGFRALSGYIGKEADTFTKEALQ